MFFCFLCCCFFALTVNLINLRAQHMVSRKPILITDIFRSECSSTRDSVCLSVSRSVGYPSKLRRINNVSEKLSRHNIIDSTQLRWVPYRPTNRQTALVEEHSLLKMRNCIKKWNFIMWRLNQLFKLIFLLKLYWNPWNCVVFRLSFFLIFYRKIFFNGLPN